MYNPIKPTTSSVIELIRSTWETPYIKVTPSTYAMFEKKFAYPEVDHTDGIGTKGIYHWNEKTFKNAVIDALAMNLNDLLLVRAIAYKLQNHLVLPKEDKQVIEEIMTTLVDECKKRKIAITGGETSIHNVKNSFDIGITLSGFIKKKITNKAQIGDVVVGLQSSGLHSNGYTLVRKLFKDEMYSEFIKPTKIYYDDLIRLLDTTEIHGMMHITGGAFTKIKGIINEKQDVVLESLPKPQKIFYEIYENDISNERMYTTFNCGTGFILTMPEKDARKIVKDLFYAKIVGEVKKGNGNIFIKSSFDKHTINL